MRESIKKILYFQFVNSIKLQNLKLLIKTLTKTHIDIIDSKACKNIVYLPSSTISQLPSSEWYCQVLGIFISLRFIIIILLSKCIVVGIAIQVLANECTPLWKPQALSLHGAAVAVGCKSSDMVTRNHTGVLCKSNTSS